MDQVKIGKFIAELRRRAGLTQEALGEKIGVTNKTISRWENGDYMPNIEMLQLLAEEFSISISEILAGEKFSDEESRHKADENAIATTSTSAFSLKERKTFFKKKWRREHFSLFAVLALILIAAVVFPLVFHKPWLLGIAPLVALVEYGFQNNRMMVYVEKCLYKRKRRSCSQFVEQHGSAAAPLSFRPNSPRNAPITQKDAPHRARRAYFPFLPLKLSAERMCSHEYLL